MILNVNLSLRRRVRYFNLLSSRARRLVKENIYLTIFFFVEIYLKTYGLEIKEIHLKEFNEDIITDYDENDLNLQSKKNAYREFKKKIKISNDDLVRDPDLVIEKTAVARELTNLSENSYRQLKLNFKSFVKLAPLYKLNIFKKKLNQFFQIQSNRYGVYIDAKFKIEFVLKKIYQNLLENNINIDERIFKIHLSGDGANVTKTRIKIIKFTFRVINEPNNSVYSVYHLGELFFIILKMIAHNILSLTHNIF
jgi:hypothetical protein